MLPSKHLGVRKGGLMSSRTVLVFWDSNHNPEQNAKSYYQCVAEAPAVMAGRVVACRLIDTTGNDPAKKHWSGSGTIEVVGVKDDAKQSSLLNPSFLCDDIRTMVEDLCR